MTLGKIVLSAWQSKAGCLEQSLREITERYQLEKQKRKQLHNRLVVSVTRGKCITSSPGGSEEGAPGRDMSEAVQHVQKP